MFRLTVLVASMAAVVMGSVANFCVQEPFRQMQDFRDFDLAMERCALHYAAPTIEKTLRNECLTTTKTVILATSTVRVTSHVNCPTDEPHVEIRDLAPLERRAEEVQWSEPTGDDDGTWSPGGQWSEPAGDDGTWSPGGQWSEPNGDDDGTWSPGGQWPETNGDDDGTWPPWSPGGQWPEHTWSHHTRTHHHHHHHHTRSRHHHTRTHHHTHHHSKEPHEMMENQWRAGPTPVTFFKRDTAATKTAEWSNYYAELAECGYDCIQTACSCVGTLQVVLRTPVPTCTSTLTKETVVHETKTLQITPDNC